MKKAEGYYFGTVIDGKWWKRYGEKGFFARGNGLYWIDGDDFCFQKHLSGDPIRIPLRAVDEVSVGKWHAGKWGGGRPVVKIGWTENGRRLVAGFTPAGGAEECGRIVDEVRRAAGFKKPFCR